MKTNEGGYRRARAPQPVRPSVSQAMTTRPDERAAPGTSARAQRRFREREERKRQRKELRREKAQETKGE